MEEDVASGIPPPFCISSHVRHSVLPVLSLTLIHEICTLAEHNPAENRFQGNSNHKELLR